MIFSLLFLIPPSIDSIILKGMDAGYREEYPVAESLFNMVIEALPEHPAGYFLKAALYELMYFDLGHDSLKKDFERCSRIAEEKGKLYITKNPDDPWGYFFTGAVFTIEVFLKAYTGHYFSMLSKVSPALNNLTKAVEIDSSVYDAYLGLGGYDYFKGMLPFMGSEREKGIKKIKTAIERGKYTRYLATIGLANLYIREKNFEDARNVLRPLLEKFPDSRTVTWPYFTSFLEEGNPDSVLFWAERLLNLSRDNPYSWLQVQAMTGEFFLKKKMYKEAGEITSNIPETSNFKDLRKKVIKIHHHTLSRDGGLNY